MYDLVHLEMSVNKHTYYIEIMGQNLKKSRNKNLSQDCYVRIPEFGFHQNVSKVSTRCNLKGQMHHHDDLGSK